MMDPNTLRSTSHKHSLRSKSIPLHYQKRYTANRNQILFNHSYMTNMYKQRSQSLLKNNRFLADAYQKCRCDLSSKEELLADSGKNIDIIMFSKNKMVEMAECMKRAVSFMEEILSKLNSCTSTPKRAMTKDLTCYLEFKNKMQKLRTDPIQECSEIEEIEMDAPVKVIKNVSTSHMNKHSLSEKSKSTSVIGNKRSNEFIKQPNLHTSTNLPKKTSEVVKHSNFKQVNNASKPFFIQRNTMSNSKGVLSVSASPNKNIQNKTATKIGENLNKSHSMPDKEKLRTNSKNTKLDILKNKMKSSKSVSFPQSPKTFKRKEKDTNSILDAVVRDFIEYNSKDQVIKPKLDEHNNSDTVAIANSKLNESSKSEPTLHKKEKITSQCNIDSKTTDKNSIVSRTSTMCLSLRRDTLNTPVSDNKKNIIDCKSENKTNSNKSMTDKSKDENANTCDRQSCPKNTTLDDTLKVSNGSRSAGQSYPSVICRKSSLKRKVRFSFANPFDISPLELETSANSDIRRKSILRQTLPSEDEKTVDTNCSMKVTSEDSEMLDKTDSYQPVVHHTEKESEGIDEAIPSLSTTKCTLPTNDFLNVLDCNTSTENPHNELKDNLKADSGDVSINTTLLKENEFDISDGDLDPLKSTEKRRRSKVTSYREPSLKKKMRSE